MDKKNTRLFYATTSMYYYYHNHVIHLHHMWSQNIFHAEKFEKSFFLAFEVESNIMTYSRKPLSEQQFEKNFHLTVQNSVSCDYIQSQFQLHAKSEKSKKLNEITNRSLS